MKAQLNATRINPALAPLNAFSGLFAKQPNTPRVQIAIRPHSKSALYGLGFNVIDRPFTSVPAKTTALGLFVLQNESTFALNVRPTVRSAKKEYFNVWNKKQFRHPRKTHDARLLKTDYRTC